MYQKSKSGLWHKIDGVIKPDKNLPKCQSYNLDKPNWLTGEIVKEIPAGERYCKKCCK